MSYYAPKIPLEMGDTVRFDDGPEIEIIEVGEFDDKYVVKVDGERESHHIDWFYEIGAEADEIHITRT